MIQPEQPTITIAIPSFNKSKYILRTINSALKQTCPADQIIVIDNVSTDGTAAIARSVGQEVRVVVNKKNLGMSGNFNQCIDLCNTDYLLILHADDELLPTAIQLYRKYIQRYPEAGIFHANSATHFEQSDKYISAAQTEHQELWRSGSEGLSCPYGACSTVLVKTRAYKKLGKFITESLSSDAEMWARIASAFDVVRLNAPTAIIHIDQESTGYESLTKRSVKTILADWDNLTNHIAKYHPTEEERIAYLKRMQLTRSGDCIAILRACVKTKKYKNVVPALIVLLRSPSGIRTIATNTWAFLTK